jgi:indole-3-glycerol phosphate synthase
MPVSGSDRTDSILERIIANKREEVAARRGQMPLPELKARVRELAPTRDFRKAILRGDGERKGLPIRLIAEIKKASPSRGLLREDFDPQALAKAYSEAGASALSILTDSAFFQGSFEYLRGAKGWVDLPLLQKDFILVEYQVWEGRCWGADAILLIAAALEPGTLRDLTQLALDLGLEPLIEVHDSLDLAQALRAKSRVIGINNRNLRSFEVNLNTTLNLVREIPQEKAVVSESGISTRKEVVSLEEAGLDAILVGEALMRSEDPHRKVRELLGRS